MVERSWTTIAIQKRTLKRLNSRKAHPRQTHTELIDLLLDTTDEQQVKLNATRK